MANLNLLLDHIARYLKDMLDRFLSVLSFIDITKNELDEAASKKEDAASN